ncbi:MAG: trmD [Chlamydiia bacterium]|nr:trmD [Chlamydiia bacterium]
MKIDVLSLFPDYFRGPLDESILKRAREKGLIEIDLVNIRDYTLDKHRRVDDRCYGGGPGMVMMAEPICRAVHAKRREGSRVIFLSPQGPTLNAKKCRELAKEDHLILLCGHYEGIDERVLESEVDEEISIGDFVLTNGCLAACVLIDSVARFIPGVIGDERAANEDSFEAGLLDFPQYTRPEVFEGNKVPEVLLSGNHKEIEAWRKTKALEKTKQVRPDLYQAYEKLK